MAFIIAGDFHSRTICAAESNMEKNQDFSSAKKWKMVKK